jgi:hypothetical protein
MEFEKLSLHDATLQEFRCEWETSQCVLEFRTSRGNKRLVFEGVTDVSIPHKNPWGPSVSLNETRMSRDAIYEIEMQSGDVIRINARAWRLDDNSKHEP